MPRAQRGDEGAYVELLVMLAGLTRHLVYRKLRRLVPWADDVVQETLISIHLARHTYDPRRPFAPWYYAIARNRLIDVLRREERVTRRELAGDDWPENVTEHVPPDTTNTNLELEAVLAALETLSPRQREIVESLKLREETVRETAARLGMTQSAVKVTAHRGYRAIRRLLGVDA